MTTERFKLVPAVYLILKKDDQILLSLRKNTGYADGFYGLVAGHLDGGENATDGMLREVKEEIGLDISRDNLKMVCVMHRLASSREVMDLFFAVEAWGGEIQNCEPDKCAALEFFPVGSLPNNIIPYMEIAIKAVESGQKYIEHGWDNPDILPDILKEAI